MVLKIGFVILVGRVFSVQVLDALAFFFFGGVSHALEKFGLASPLTEAPVN
jgi:hypothetical protein